MKTRTTWAMMLALLLLGCGALAIDQEDVSKLPGYVDFGPLEVVGDWETPELDLIEMVAAVTRRSEPELSRAIAKLKQVRVLTCKGQLDKLDELKAKTAAVSRRLEPGLAEDRAREAAQGWQGDLRVHEVGR